MWKQFKSVKKDSCEKSTTASLCPSLTPTPFFRDWASPDFMWHYLTKTLLCIIGLQPRSPGADCTECMSLSIQEWIQGQAWGHVVELNAAALSIHVAAGVRGGGADGFFRLEQASSGFFSLKQASSAWSTCLPDARDRQQASAAYLDSCVYSGKCASQVPVLKTAFWLNLNEEIQQMVDGKWLVSQCLLCSFHSKLRAMLFIC